MNILALVLLCQRSLWSLSLLECPHDLDVSQAKSSEGPNDLQADVVARIKIQHLQQLSDYLVWLHAEDALLLGMRGERRQEAEEKSFLILVFYPYTSVC